jgi:predicted DNA-binding transcriptional regulator YafY
MQAEEARSVKILYRNYKGEVSWRRIVPEGKLIWGTTEYYPETQWLLLAFDLDKDAERTFAFKNIQAWC